MSTRSMTGFARVRHATDETELIVGIKSLNHRGLDLHFHLPAELDPYENSLRGLLKKRLARGQIDVRVSYVRLASEGGFAINQPLLAQYLRAFRTAAEQHGLEPRPDLNAALRLPGMLTDQVNRDAPEIEADLLRLANEAIDHLNEFRAREGAELCYTIRERNEAIVANGRQIAAIRERAMPSFQARLQERLAELLRGAHLEPQRLAHEVAVLVDRSDVQEETQRLQIHSTQVARLLDEGGEIGKKLDFLLQEMNREANTILSKTTGIGETGLGITELALALKADIEKIREQALNLE